MITMLNKKNNSNMIHDVYRPGCHLVNIALVLAFFVITLGAFTRLVDAGLGCPDWPGCYGHLSWPNSSEEIHLAERLFPEFPVDTQKTWPEMVHRYFAGILGLLIAWIAIVAIRQRKKNYPLKLPMALLILVVVQALFGMWTVTLKLWPQIVTAHLLGGFSTLALLWLLRLRLKKNFSNSGTKVMVRLTESKIIRWKWARNIVAISCIVVIGQIALGGWTSSNYAAMACPDFPTCHQQWIPQTNFSEGFNVAQTIGPNYLGGLLDGPARTAIHLSHRIGALFVMFFILAGVFILWSLHQRLALYLLFALVLQIGLGICNVMLSLPLLIAVAHNLGGALLFLTVITVLYHSYSVIYVHRKAVSESEFEEMAQWQNPIITP
ncbi:COX15/CtaA family protein [Marinibactrum halimedae]|nr:COX15/CtaA family protein [Marinibactrum halimedae]MCD9461053.1 COX15/CtaA family protein [Marinibactrum halimedae]